MVKWNEHEGGMKIKVYPHVVGNTLGSHETFLKRIKKRGAKIMKTQDESDETIVFCPIASRFETDVQSALSTISDNRRVILVAMHHTFDPNYSLPERRPYDSPKVKLIVECLFYEKTGLYKCKRNSNAKKRVYKELGLPKRDWIINRGTKNKVNKAKREKSREK